MGDGFRQVPALSWWVCWQAGCHTTLMLLSPRPSLPYLLRSCSSWLASHCCPATVQPGADYSAHHFCNVACTHTHHPTVWAPRTTIPPPSSHPRWVCLLPLIELKTGPTHRPHYVNWCSGAGKTHQLEQCLHSELPTMLPYVEDSSESSGQLTALPLAPTRQRSNAIQSNTIGTYMPKPRDLSQIPSKYGT